MQLFKKYLYPFRFGMICGLTIKFIGTIMDLFIPRILQHIIDNVVPEKSTPAIVFWGIVMLLCSGVALLGNIIANRMAADVAKKSTANIRHDLFKKTLSLSNKTVDEYTIPTLETRLTTDTYNVHQIIGMMQRMGVRAPILLIGGIIMTSIMEPVLTLVLLAALPIIFLIFYIISRKGTKLYSMLQQTIDSLVRTVRENIQGIRVIKALSKTEYESKKFEEINENVYKAETSAGSLMAKSNPLMALTLNIGLISVIIVGAYRVNAGICTPVKIISFLTYFTIILNAMMTINRIFVMLSKGTASAKRITEILETKSEFEGEEYAEKLSKHGKYRIEFRNVSFSYNNTYDNLKNVSFAVEPGQTLGIIGATGSGKSTIIRLLMRFYDADSGEILIDGNNIKTIEPSLLRAKFGVVLQNDFLVADTVKENIAFGRDLNENDLEEAISLSQAKQFVDSFSDRLEHKLTASGTNISGGQQQRLLISRAVASKPEILVLDDSSSALDYKTDALLRRAIQTQSGISTSVIIAQRISSVMNADLILVIENGEIIASGTHAELINTCPAYKSISDSQLGGAFVE